MNERYDYIVVGAGAAGCVVAGRLAGRAGKVLLLEAGKSEGSWVYKLPAACGLAVRRDETNWRWETDPVPALDNRPITFGQGRMLGGSSGINGMVYTRGHSADYDAWERLGCTGWGFKDLLPYFRKLESHERGASHWHGDSGPIKVRQSRRPSAICDIFLAGAKEAGFAVVDDLNQDAMDAFGYFDINEHRGKRVSAADAYIRDGQGSANLTIQTEAMVRRVVIESGRVVGVDARIQGADRRIYADREVIIAAGAVKSPHILMLSGIGDASALRRHGIQVVHHSPEVGKNYQNHPYYPTSYLCSKPVTSQAYANPIRALWAGIEYAATRGGMLSETLFPVGGFFRSSPSLKAPDIQLVLTPALLLQASMGAQPIRNILKAPHGFLAALNLGTPYSRGEVYLRSANPEDRPAIQPNYFKDPRDMAAMKTAIRTVQEIIRAPSIKRVIKEEVMPGALVGDDDDLLEQSIRANGGTYAHQSGTCRMGADEASVVDLELRVRGVSGLRVVDASIMPQVPNANLHAPALMVGEKGAAEILKGN